MNTTDLPPLPPVGVISPEACDIVSLYIAVSHDLTADQRRKVSAHLQSCSRCTREYRLMRRASQLVGSIEATEPSARVDQAVRAAIAAASGGRQTSDAPLPLRPMASSRNSRKKRFPLAGLVAAAAVLVIALVGLLHFVIMPGTTTHAFSVPTYVSWDGVLYHTQTIVAGNGGKYHVASYHDMKNDMMNVETTMDGKLDIMAVSDGHQTLGMDMMHNVAQSNAKSWLSDDSMFDLNQLRKDLLSGKAIYLGTGTFNGQDVYRINDEGKILLLNMSYKPVNVLQAVNGSSTEKPIYDELQLLDKAPSGMDMGNMTLPKGFKIGSLPVKP